MATENRTEVGDTLRRQEFFSSRDLAEPLPEKNSLPGLRVDGQTPINGSKDPLCESISVPGTYRQETSSSQRDFTSKGVVTCSSAKRITSAQKVTHERGKIVFRN